MNKFVVSQEQALAFKKRLQEELEAKRDAMTGLATGKKVTRPQEILTPKSVIDFCRELWGAGVYLDPCAARGRNEIVQAEHCEYENGLELIWADRTYVNPPYKDLKAWMCKAVRAAGNGDRIVMLAPTRGHRQWWHDCRDTCDAVVELAPLKFAGYDQAFPAPLSLLIWNLYDACVSGALDRAGLKYTKVSFL